MLRIAENAIHGLVAADSRVNGGQTGGRIPCMLLLCLCFPPTCLRGCAASVRERILWVRPEFSKICRSVGGFDFQPCPMRLQGFFCLGERRRFWILMRALRFAQDSRIESDHPRAVRGVVRFACGACVKRRSGGRRETCPKVGIVRRLSMRFTSPLA